VSGGARLLSAGGLIGIANVNVPATTKDRVPPYRRLPISARQAQNRFPILIVRRDLSTLDPIRERRRDH